MWEQDAAEARAKADTAPPGKHGDGRGLFLYVKGVRFAVPGCFRYQMQGRRRDLGLGAYPDVTLAMARERAMEAAAAHCRR